MTRESKLALIVGFGLILFVGILVSDHFSSGQRQEAAHLLAQRGAARTGGGPISIEPLPTAADMVRVDHAELARRSAAEQERRLNEAGIPGLQRGDDEVVLTRRVEVPQPPVERDMPRGDAPSGSGAEANIRLYPVKEGETLFSIAAQQYGDGSLWQALAEFNKSVVPNPARMRKGVTLRLPPIEVLRPGRSSSPVTPTPPVREQTIARQPATETAGIARASHTVQRGETLSQIAERRLGSRARWPELAQLNRDVVPNPNALTPGVVLRLPDQG